MVGSAASDCGYLGSKGLVFKALRLVYHSTLGLRVIKQKKKSSGSRTRPSIYLYLSFYLSIYPSMYLSIYLSMHLRMHGYEAATVDSLKPLMYIHI